MSKLDIFQVVNKAGYPAGNDQHEFALFRTTRTAMSYIKYLNKECSGAGKGCRVIPATLTSRAK